MGTYGRGRTVEDDKRFDNQSSTTPHSPGVCVQLRGMVEDVEGIVKEVWLEAGMILLKRKN